jgi:hypothetical protein
MFATTRRKELLSGAILALLGGLALGCESSVLEPLNDRGDLDAAAAGGFEAWSTAANIEDEDDAPPGADADFNTDALDGCPFISRDGKSFYIASDRTSADGGAGGDLDIWVSTRASVHDPWGEPVNVGEPVNSEANDFCPTIARDGHTFYFVSTRQEGTFGQDFCGGGDIYVTRLRNDGSFEEPKNLGCQVNSAATEFSPFPLPERGSGPVLYFSRKLGAAPGDIYISRSHGGVFGPAELVPGLNSDDSGDDDGQPNLRRDGLEIFFYSDRSDEDAQGGNDIYLSTRTSTSAPWSKPDNLGDKVNSPGSETRPSLSWDGTTLYFGSNRAESEAGSSDIYVTKRVKMRGN